MSSWYKKLEVWVTRIVVGTFMPDLGKQMEQEGLFDPDNPPEHLLIEDNGADLTIFSFSGFDVLFAGLTRFEFGSALKAIGEDANYVFIRDVHRTGFHLTPDMQQGGVAFFENEIERIKKELGSTRNVAVGSSSGGTAALHFASRCGFDEAIVFGAVLDLDVHTRGHAVRRTVFAWRLLLREPAAYFESLVVLLGGRWGLRKLRREVGRDALMDPLQAFIDCGEQRPEVTFYYGARSYIDAEQAALLKEYDTVRLVPLPTGRHNTPSYLKQRGQLSMAIAAAVSEGAEFDPDENPAPQAAGAA